MIADEIDRHCVLHDMHLIETYVLEQRLGLHDTVSFILPYLLHRGSLSLLF